MTEFTNTPNQVPTLRGNLEAFVGTPAQDIVLRSILYAGFDPNTYDPQALGHANYYGLPYSRTEPEEGHMSASPIYRHFYDSYLQARIDIADVPSGSVRFRREPLISETSGNSGRDLTQVTDKLDTIGMLAFVDAETGVTLAYLVDSSRAARHGQVIVPTSLVEQVVQSEKPGVELSELIQPHPITGIDS